jgi:hypothetical protein
LDATGGDLALTRRAIAVGVQNGLDSSLIVPIRGMSTMVPIAGNSTYSRESNASPSAAGGLGGGHLEGRPGGPRSLLNNGVAGAGLAFWGGRNAAKAVERHVLSQHS